MTPPGLEGGAGGLIGAVVVGLLWIVRELLRHRSNGKKSGELHPMEWDRRIEDAVVRGLRRYYGRGDRSDATHA